MMEETSPRSTEARRQEDLLKTGALQDAIFNSVNFSIVAIDAKLAVKPAVRHQERLL